MPSDPQFLAGQRLTAAKLQLLGFQDTYTPTLGASTTDPSLGTSPVQSGYVLRTANAVDLWIWLQFGSSPSAGSGTYQISIPTGYDFAPAFFGAACGTAWLQDNSAGTVRVGVALADVITSTLWIRTTSDNTLVSNSAPWTWAQNDIISIHARYPFV